MFIDCFCKIHFGGSPIHDELKHETLLAIPFIAYPVLHVYVTTFRTTSDVPPDIGGGLLHEPASEKAIHKIINTKENILPEVIPSSSAIRLLHN